MFCRTCGATLKDDARYCYYCGHIQTPAPTIPFPDKVRYTAKKVGSSPLFLIAAICFTLVQLLEIFSLLPIGNTLALGNLFADPELLPASETQTLVTGLISMLPSLVITVGLWITYGSCASRKPKANTAGLTMIFVVSLIQLVLTCLVLLVAALFVIVLTLETDTFAAIPEALPLNTLLGIFLGMLLAIFVFSLVWYIKVCTTITNVRDTLKTGAPNKRVSSFVGVMCYISGALWIFNGTISFLNAGLQTLNGFYDDSVLYILPSNFFLFGVTSLLTAVAQILFGVLIFSYRSKMKALEAEERMHNFKTLSYAEPYTSPVYIPPQPTQDSNSIPEPEVAEDLETTAEPATEEESE